MSEVAERWIEIRAETDRSRSNRGKLVFPVVIFTEGNPDGLIAIRAPDYDGAIIGAWALATNRNWKTIDRVVEDVARLGRMPEIWGSV